MLVQRGVFLDPRYYAVGYVVGNVTLGKVQIEFFIFIFHHNLNEVYEKKRRIKKENKKRRKNHTKNEVNNKMAQKTAG